MLIYLDTETILSQDPTHWLEIVDKHAVSGVLPEIKAAANLKDPERSRPISSPEPNGQRPTWSLPRPRLSTRCSSTTGRWL